MSACQLGCPSYVRRCAHNGPSVLWLLDDRSSIEALRERGVPEGASHCPGCGRFIDPRMWNFPEDYPRHYAIFAGVIEPPQCFCTVALTPRTEANYDLYADLCTRMHEDEALLAFEKASRQLLARGL